MNKRLVTQCMLIGTLALLQVSASQAQFFGDSRGGGWGGGDEVQLNSRFDRDKNGYLDKSERRAAYNALTGNEQAGNLNADVAQVPMRNPKLTPGQVKTYPGKPLYEPLTLRTVFLNFEDPDWEAQMMAYKGTDIEMPATAIVDGRTYKNVGVHFRGQTSFMTVPEGYKHSLKVSFDFVDKQQRVLGYQSLELLNAAADPSYMRNVLYMQVAREYLPAPKANYMRVVINGENWGIYINSQPFNGDFVKEVTGGNSGARWKVQGSPQARGGLEYFGDDLDYYQSVFDITSKDKSESWDALINLTKVLSQTPPDRLEAALKPILDIDGVLRFLAVDNALINNDGYWVRASDYSIFQDKSGMFHVTPHDANETFREIERMGGMGRRSSGVAASTGVSLDPLVSISDASKPLLSKLLAVPALKQRYLGYVRDIATKWLDWNRLSPLVMQYHNLIADDVKIDQRKLYSTEKFTNSITQDGGSEGFGPVSSPSLSLKSFVQQRQVYLLNYFATSPGGSTRRTGT